METDTFYRDVYYVVKKRDCTLNSGAVFKV